MPSIHDEFRSLASTLKGLSFIRVITHYDADGISAGGVLCRALHRAGVRFHCTMLRELKAPDPEWWSDSDLVVMLDMGSSVVEAMGRCGGSAVLDHHVMDGSGEAPSNVIHINPRMHGIDGTSGACASTLAYLAAEAMDPANVDLAPYAIGGMIGDRQHVGGFSGLNTGILERAVAAGEVEIVKGLPLFGSTVAEALELSNDPFYMGLSGEPDSVDAFLREIGIDPASTVADVESDPVKASILMSRLALKLVGQGTALENVKETFTDKYRFPRLGTDGFMLANVINSTGRLGVPGVGLAVVMGDPGAMEEGCGTRAKYRRNVQKGLIGLRERTTALERVQYFDNTVPNMGGALSGLGVSYILDPERAAIAFTASGSDLKISGRATRALVSQGLDLASALAKAAGAVGGGGGGHPIAAGATVPADRKEEFLSTLDDALIAQVGLVAK